MHAQLVEHLAERKRELLKEQKQGEEVKALRKFLWLFFRPLVFLVAFLCGIVLAIEIPALNVAAECIRELEGRCTCKDGKSIWSFD